MNEQDIANWTSFFLLITIQAFVLALVEYEERFLNSGDRHQHTLLEALIAGLLGGLALGLIFDEIVGRQFNFFHYYIGSIYFQILNGGLSYGLAIATALQFSPKPRRAIDGLLAPNTAILFAITAGVFVFSLREPTDLTTAIAVGWIIVLAGELFELLIFRTNGPVLEALSGHVRRPIRNWTITVFVGCAYETANRFEPVWQWWFAKGSTAIWYELAVVTFGYVVLLHACRIIGFTALAAFKSVRATRP